MSKSVQAMGAQGIAQTDALSSGQDMAVAGPNPQPGPAPKMPSDSISTGKSPQLDALHLFATGMMTTMSRVSGEAVPIFEAGAMRALGGIGALLSLSGDTPQNRSTIGPTTGQSRDNSGILELQRYPNVDSRSLSAGTAALADFNQCHPNDMNKLPGGKGFQTFTGQSDAAFTALKNALGNAPIDANGKPYQLHHLVEQGTGTKQFGTQAIQNTANVVAVPKSVHDKISAFYNTNAAKVKLQNVDGKLVAKGTVRDYVSKLRYDQQRQFGINQTRRYVNADTTLSPEEKSRISKQLNDLQQAEPPKDPSLCFHEAR